MPVIAEHLKIYLSGPVSYREFRETGPWPQLFKGHRIDCYLTDKMIGCQSTLIFICWVAIYTQDRVIRPLFEHPGVRIKRFHQRRARCNCKGSFFFVKMRFIFILKKCIVFIALFALLLSASRMSAQSHGPVFFNCAPASRQARSNLLR